MTLKISSTPTSILKIEKYARDLRQELNLNEETYGNLLISLTEAVNNAIRHGNKLDATKKVIVTSGLYHKQLSISISDEGKGFDPETVCDPTQDENLCKCGGRGVFLIRQLADDVAFLNNGSTVRLAFNL